MSKKKQEKRDGFKVLDPCRHEEFGCKQTNKNRKKKKKKIDCDMRHTVRGFSIESCKHAMRHMVREFLTKPNTLLLDSFVCCMPKNQLIL